MRIDQDVFPMPVQELLRKLGGIGSRSARDRSTEAPRVTVYSTCGRSFCGRILAVVEEPAMVLLMGLGDIDERFDNLLYLDESSVSAIAVHDAKEVAHLFSDRIEAPRTEPAPTRLQLKRAMKGLTDALASELDQPLAIDVDWAVIPRDEAAYISLESVITTLGEALRSVCHDPQGKRALQRVQVVRIAVGERSLALAEQGGGQAVDQTVDLTVDLTEGPAGRFTVAELVAALERAL